MRLKTITIILLVLSISGWAGVKKRDLEYLDTKYVRVVERVPVYDNVYNSTPYEDCWDERVEVYDDDYYYDTRPNPGAVILGGVVGGLVGNRVGRRGSRHHRRVATIGGAILGGLIGNNISQSHRRHGDRRYGSHYETKKVCQTRYRNDNRRVLIGYDNIAYYNGHRIVKFSKRRLRKIPVSLAIDY